MFVLRETFTFVYRHTDFFSGNYLVSVDFREHGNGVESLSINVFSIGAGAAIESQLRETGMCRDFWPGTVTRAAQVIRLSQVTSWVPESKSESGVRSLSRNWNQCPHCDCNSFP